MDSRLRTPLVLIIFNRPERTTEVFAEIRAAQPSELFIIADGPVDGVAVAGAISLGCTASAVVSVVVVELSSSGC